MIVVKYPRYRPILVTVKEVINVDAIFDILKAVGINAASYFVYKLIDWLFSDKK